MVSVIFLDIGNLILSASFGIGKYKEEEDYIIGI